MQTKKIYAVLNPVAGRTQVQNVRSALTRTFKPPDYQLELYETDGDECVAELVRQAIKDGVSWVFAAGGDGTVSEVADGLAHTGVPLGIIPTGTNNVLAQELGIPLNVEEACRAMAGSEGTKKVDAMRVGDRFFVIAVGAGADAITMDQTSRKRKRRYGMLAYVWSILKTIFTVQQFQVLIEADGDTINLPASVVLLTNVATLTRPLKWGPHIRPDDGQIDIIIVRGKHLLDYMLAVLDVLPGLPRRPRHIRYFAAQERVTISADKVMPVEGDGDLIGQTPVTVQIVPEAITVLLPPRKKSGMPFDLPIRPFNR